MKIRQRRSVVTDVSDRNSPASRGSKLVTLFYVAVWASVLGGAAYIAADQLFFYEVPGIVQVEATTVSTPRAGTVMHLAVDEGSHVREGSILATIAPTAICDPPAPTHRLNVQADLEHARGERTRARASLADKRSRLDRWRRDEALELDPGHTAVRRQLERDIEGLEERLAALGDRIRVWTSELDSIAGFDRGEACRPFEVEAPFAGTVAALYGSAHESFRDGEPLLAIRPAEPEVRVFAYLDPDTYESVVPGKTVRVDFPDGTISDGVVEATLAAGEQFSEKKWDGYQPVAAVLLARVRPTSEAEASLWR
ncbi:MAG: HlyD family secretion protein, partial [Gemmatimonadetes bacterium]|nr:HlyD family secretion protein [Gemmatimonadota bacterium]